VRVGPPFFLYFFQKKGLVFAYTVLCRLERIFSGSQHPTLFYRMQETSRFPLALFPKPDDPPPHHHFGHPAPRTQLFLAVDLPHVLQVWSLLPLSVIPFFRSGLPMETRRGTYPPPSVGLTGQNPISYRFFAKGISPKVSFPFADLLSCMLASESPQPWLSFP